MVSYQIESLGSVATSAATTLTARLFGIIVTTTATATTIAMGLQ